MDIERDKSKKALDIIKEEFSKLKPHWQKVMYLLYYEQVDPRDRRKWSYRKIAREIDRYSGKASASAWYVDHIVRSRIEKRLRENLDIDEEWVQQYFKKKSS